MSAGNFSDAFYTADSGLIHPMRVQPETLAAVIGGATNAATAGPATSNQFVKISKARRERGIGSRYITARWTTTQPTDYAVNGKIRIAIPDPTVFAGINLFDTGTYLGQGITVTGVFVENVK